ncbi:probable sonic hedgehog protein A [Coccomyxa sp. Obi]|nr:probable sonic hedgehog protein A [Coccomyxa sp. Obi]
MLHTDLLAGVPGYFWGNLTASDVQQACRYLTAEGANGLQADVVVGNKTYTEDLKVTAMGYCDLTNRSPSGAQVMFSEQKGMNIAVFCGPVLDLVNGSCAAYILGADVTNEYDRYKSSAAHNCAGCQQDCICVDQDQDKNCFPGDAQVLVKGEGQLDMSEVRVGDMLQSIAANGSLIYDEVYFFGHRNSSALGQFVSLWVVVPNHPAAIIKMSPRHFIPVFGSSKGSKATYAKDVRVGDNVMMVGANGPVSGKVVAKHLTISKGLYNPYTKGGNVVVNRVLASAHSSYVLDDIVPESMAHYLPTIYNTFFRPLYWLHKMGSHALVERMVKIFNFQARTCQ